MIQAHDHKWRHRLGNGAYFSFVIKFHNFSRKVLIKFEIPGFEMQAARKINDYVTTLNSTVGTGKNGGLKAGADESTNLDRILLFPVFSRNLNND